MSAAQQRDRFAPVRVDDWRVLAVLGPYRLLLVAVLLTLYRTGYAPDLLRLVSAGIFYYGCLAYSLAALLLLLLGVYRVPRLSLQAHLHLAVDVLTITALVFVTGGVGGGLGILLVPPVVGSSLVLKPRMAAVHAAVATLAMFGAEALKQLRLQSWDSSDFSQTGLLGLMFFTSSLVANTVAQRARRSEAMAQRVGSQFVNLARLSDNIIETMQTGVLVIDAQDRVRTANAAARRLTGGALNLGEPLAQQLPQLFEALLLWRVDATELLAPCMAGSNGAEVFPRFTRLGWGEEAQTLVLIEDAAALRQQAQQMKLAALGRLSASIAHEIRNPLSAITQASQLLAESPALPAQDQRLLQIILRHTARIDRIVRDVLDLGRRDRSQQRLLPLREWLQRTSALYHESHRDPLRPIELAGIGIDVHVRFDPEHLQQVLFNLWDNSFEHGGSEGRTIRVQLHAESVEEGVLLRVCDNGPGIPVELHERIFEPFFTTDGSGTGLGLFLCRELCEYNGASLSYQPRPDGACFCIRMSAVERGQLTESR